MDSQVDTGSHKLTQAQKPHWLTQAHSLTQAQRLTRAQRLTKDHRLTQAHRLTQTHRLTHNTNYSLINTPWTEELGRLQSMGSQELDVTWQLNQPTNNGIIIFNM